MDDRDEETPEIDEPAQLSYITEVFAVVLAAGVLVVFIAVVIRAARWILGF